MNNSNRKPKNAAEAGKKIFQKSILHIILNVFNSKKFTYLHLNAHTVIFSAIMCWSNNFCEWPVKGCKRKLILAVKTIPSSVILQKVISVNILVVFQRICSHICLAKLILSCCFTLFGRPSSARTKQQENINFAKQICESSCWRTKQISIFNFADKTFCYKTDGM